jgi:hypothetical protein
LDELAKALGRFVWHDERSFYPYPWTQERHRYPGFIGVVEAVQPLRGLKATGGWPAWLADLIAAIIKTFDELAYSWGWSELLKSEEFRTAYVKRCEDKFRASYLGPIHEAAKACRQNLSVIDSPSFLEELCESVPPIDFDLISFTNDLGPLKPLFEAFYRKRQGFLLGESYPIMSELGGDTGDFKSVAVLGGTLSRACQKLTNFVGKVKSGSAHTDSVIANSEDVNVAPATQLTDESIRPACPSERMPPDATMRTPEPLDSTTISGSNQTVQRDKVIVSYCHKDKKFLDELVAHLSPLQRAGRVVAWSDRDIQPGSQWFSQIQSAAASARVAVLLVTKDFLTSHIIHNHELGPLLTDAEAGGVTILWVLVRACNWNATPLRHLQAAYPTDRPLAQMKAERDTAWVTICAAIEAAANLE